MVVTARSLGLNGISGYEVSVECFLSGGLPWLWLAGMAALAVYALFSYIRLLRRVQVSIRVEEPGAPHIPPISPARGTAFALRFSHPHGRADSCIALECERSRLQNGQYERDKHRGFEDER